MQNSLISTRITCLYRSQPLSVVFACKTAPFGPELQVSLSPRHSPSFCACKTARFAPELQVSVGPTPHLSFCAGKTVCLTSEILVSMGPRPHLWILIAKQRLLVQNYKSLWVQDLTCRLVHAKHRPELQVSMGHRPHLCFSACQTAYLASELLVSMGPSPHLWFLHAIQRD